MSEFVPLYRRPEDQALAIYIVEQHGLKPNDIILDSVGEDGYELAARRENGQVILDVDGFAVNEFQPWPLGFPVQQFLALLWGRSVDLT